MKFKDLANKIKNFIIKFIYKKNQVESIKVGSCFIYCNNSVDLVYRACKVCINGKIDGDYKAKVGTIGRVISYGHESVLEHSNLVIALNISKNVDMMTLSEFTSVLHYLNYHTYLDKDKNLIMIIGGSIRGYKHIFRNIKNQNNILAQEVKSVLYMYTAKEFYPDFIADNIMDENQFIGDSTLSASSTHFKGTRGANKKVFLIDISHPTDIIDAIKEYCGVEIPMRDSLDFASLTILFNKMSRTASHQLVRHRNAISQESQRYVDYSNAGFVNPLKEQYKSGSDKYHIKIFDKIYSLTLDEIANMETSLYSQLREDGSLKKEDARSILPSNVTTKLYMTFTFTNFIKFLELRTASGAQAEIRNLAMESEKLFRMYTEFGDEDIYKYIAPSYKAIDNISYDTVDEIVDNRVEEKEEDISMNDLSDNNMKKIVDISEDKSIDEVVEKEKDADIKVKSYDELLDKYNSSAFNDQIAIDEEHSKYVCKEGIWLRVANNNIWGINYKK